MADPKGFLTTPRETPARRPVDLRLLDWREVYEPFPPGRLERQAGRCMDCGIPFCHHGCPLGNLLPEWNDLVYRDDWPEAIERLHATNNFPEFTGRLCPAPCESACVLGINADPVTIKQVEVEIIDKAFASGWVTPRPPAAWSGRSAAVIGFVRRQTHRRRSHRARRDPRARSNDGAKAGSPDSNASSARCAAAVQRQARPLSPRLVGCASVAARQNRLTAQFRPPKRAWRSPRLRPRDLSLSIGVVETAVTDQSVACAPNRRRAVGRAGVCAVENMLAAA